MNGINIQIKEAAKTQYIDLHKATVTNDGKIQLPDGRIFSVNLSKNGENLTHLTANQLQTLATKALKILQNTGEKFQTLDQLPIKKHSVTHLVGGKTQEFSEAGINKGKWKQTATKIIDQFSKPIDQKDKQSSPFLNTNKNKPGNVQFQIKEKQNNTPSVRPRSLELESPNKSKSRRRLSDVFSGIKTEKQETKPILNTKIEIPQNDKKMQRETVSNVISQTLSNEGPKEVAGKLVNVLANKNPTIKEKVDTFRNLHKEKIKVFFWRTKCN